MLLFTCFVPLEGCFPQIVHDELSLPPFHSCLNFPAYVVCSRAGHKPLETGLSGLQGSQLEVDWTPQSSSFLVMFEALVSEKRTIYALRILALSTWISRISWFFLVYFCIDIPPTTVQSKLDTNLKECCGCRMCMYISLQLDLITFWFAAFAKLPLSDHHLI